MRKPRDNALPVLQRFHSTDRHSQECIIEVREPECTTPSGVGEGEWEEGSSGSSRGLSNIVLPIENASIDPYGKELQDIVNGENNELHQYYKLSKKKQHIK